jgi:hypothetical protein
MEGQELEGSRCTTLYIVFFEVHQLYEFESYEYETLNSETTEKPSGEMWPSVNTIPNFQ